MAYIKRVKEFITSFDKKKIACIGITFKNYSDDLRESPLLQIMLELNSEGYEIAIADEDLNMDVVNMDYKNLATLVQNVESCIHQSEMVIVSKRYLQKVLDLKQTHQIILNLSDLTKSQPHVQLFNIY